MKDWERYRREQRRLELVIAVLAWAILIVGAIVVAVVCWAVISFLLVVLS